MALNNYDVGVKSPLHHNNRRKTEQEERYHEDRIYRTGKYGHCMIGGMLQKGIAAPEDIIGSARTETTVEKVKTKFNINTTTDNKIVAVQADILLLAVKPIFFPEVIDQNQRCRGRGYPDRQHCGRKNSGLSERGFRQTGIEADPLHAQYSGTGTGRLHRRLCGRKRHGGRHGAGTGTVTFLRHCQCGTGTADGCSRRCQR